MGVQDEATVASKCSLELLPTSNAWISLANSAYFLSSSFLDLSTVTEWRRGSMDGEDQKSTDSMNPKRELPGALEGAFAVVLAQSALLISLPMISIADTKSVTFEHMLILAIAIVAFFNVAANWVSSREIKHDPIDYNSSHLFWDIAILGVLFVSTQVIIGLCGDDFSIDSNGALAVTSISYTMLSAFYLTWNFIEIKRRQASEDANMTPMIKVLIRAQVTNILSCFLSFAMLISVFLLPNTLIQTSILIAWFFLWIYICIKFIYDNSLY